MYGPDGFLDSARYQHSYKLRNDKKRSKSVPPNSSASVPVSPRSAITVVDMKHVAQSGQKNYQKSVKVIEVK